MSVDTFKDNFDHTVARITNDHQMMGEIDRENNVSLSVTVAYDQSRNYGWFEFSADDSERWYASGGLWFDNPDPTQAPYLRDYDGIFSLPDFVLIHLHKKGLDVKDMAETLKVELPEEAA